MPRCAARWPRAGIALHTSKDHVVFERSEVLTQSGGPYSVFTPYKNAWLKKLEPYFVQAYPVAHHAAALAAVPPGVPSGVPTLAEIGFEATDLHTLKLPSGASGAQELLADFLRRIDRYDETRRLPGRQGPELPVDAPALRHGVDPPAGSRGLAAQRRRVRAAPRSGCRS